MSDYDSIPINQLPVGTQVLPTDVYAAVDTTDLTESSIGTTKQYTVQQLEDRFSNSYLNSNIVSAKVATTGNLTAVYVNGNSGVGATLTNSGALSALSIDGISLNLNDRVLVSSQVNQFENGVYVVTVVGDTSTPWVLTRATDYDNHLSTQIQQGDFIGVTLGTTYQRTIWFQVAPDPIVVGTDPIIFQLISLMIAPTELWITVTTSPQSLAINTGYIINKIGPCILTLPSICPVGSIIKIQGKGPGQWRVAQNPGQQILFGNVSTTVGITGYIESTFATDNVSLLCTVADTEFIVNVPPQGNLTYS